MQTKSFDYDANEKAVAVEAPRVHVLLSVLDSAVTSVEDCLMTLAMCVEPALSPQEECEVSEKKKQGGPHTVKAQSRISESIEHEISRLNALYEMLYDITARLEI